VLQSLQRLEKRQLDQQLQINRLISNFSTLERIPDPGQDDFDVAFHRLLDLYSHMSQEERNRKIRKISTSNSVSDFLEMSSAINQTQQPILPEVTEEWESYYNEIFTSPNSTPEM